MFDILSILEDRSCLLAQTYVQLNAYSEVVKINLLLSMV